MDVDKLWEILDATTTTFRKGEPIVAQEEGGVAVARVFDMPHTSNAPDELLQVDCHFVIVGVDKVAAEGCRKELVALLDDYPQPTQLAGGPSYIEVGGVVGDQERALRLFALGEALELWTVVTPATLGVEGEMADVLAGQGMVMTSGYKPDQQEEPEGDCPAEPEPGVFVAGASPNADAAVQGFADAVGIDLNADDADEEEE